MYLWLRVYFHYNTIFIAHLSVSNQSVCKEFSFKSMLDIIIHL